MFLLELDGASLYEGRLNREKPMAVKLKLTTKTRRHKVSLINYPFCVFVSLWFRTHAEATSLKTAPSGLGIRAAISSTIWRVAFGIASPTVAARIRE
jgi:hypothetical protein